MQALGLDKPRWAGFFPGAAEPHLTPTPSKLNSLVSSFAGEKWFPHIDFTLLRRLATSWDLEDALLGSDFPSLDTLHLTDIDDESGQGQDELHRFLKNLPTLQRLTLGGYISPETFEIILDRYSETLNSLSVTLLRDEESRNPLVVFSASMVQRLAQKCPNLEQLRFPINRTRGDREETAIYRALSRFPRLRRIWLNIQYSIGPDEQFWDEERDGEYPLEFSLEEQNIPPEYLSDAFSNGALDATLALSIFHTISSGNNTLACLMIDMSRKTGLNGPAQMGSGPLQDILRWFNRPWTCERDVRGAVTVRERHTAETVGGGEEWQQLSGEGGYYGDRVFEQVFKELWPPKTAQWWNDWESLPLSD